MSGLCGLLSGCFGGAAQDTAAGLVKQVALPGADHETHLKNQAVLRQDSALEHPGHVKAQPEVPNGSDSIKAGPTPSAPASGAPFPSGHHLRRILSHARSQASTGSKTHAANASATGAPQDGPAEMCTHITTCLADFINNVDALVSHLLSAKQWLSKDGTLTGADTMLKQLGAVLQAVGSHLLQLDPPHFTPGAMSAALALMDVYNELIRNALNPRSHAKVLRNALIQQLLTRPQTVRLWCRMQQHACEQVSSGPDVRLMCWDVLRNMLRLMSKADTAVTSHSPEPPPGSATPQLAAGHCWSNELDQVVATPGGPLAQVLHLPFTMHSAASQLAVLKVLKQLYTLQASQHIHQDVASLYATTHFRQFKLYYHAAGCDPTSAAAELAGLHLEVLMAAVATQSAVVRAQLHQEGVLEHLLEGFAVEATLLSDELARLAAEQEQQEEEDSGSGSGSGSSDDEGDPAHPGSSSDVVGKQSHPRSSGPGESEGGSRARGFSFTWDLNEDFERLIAFEEETGQTVHLPGLEYDDEALHIMARSALRPVAPPPPPRSPRPPPIPLPPLKLNLPSPSLHSRSSRCSDSSHLTPVLSRATPPEASRLGSKPAVPKLALHSLRSAASSRLVTPTPHRDVFNSARSLHRDVLLSARQGPSDSSTPDTRIRDWTSQAGALGLGLPPASSTPPSARLYHSHLSPLSTQRSVPSPTTLILSHPPPSSLGTPSRSSHLLLTTSLSQPTPEQLALPLTKSQHMHGDPEVQCAADQPGVLPRSGTQGQGECDEYDRQVTCAAFLQQPITHQDAVTVRAEMHDAVPDLQPWPPAQPHPGGPVGQSGRGSRPVPALNLKNLSARGADGLASGSRASHDSVLLTGATMTDSAMNPYHARPSLGRASSRAFATQRLPGGDVMATHASGYQQAVQAKLWYHDPALHASLLYLLFSLLLLPTGGLDPTYMQPVPGEAGRLNVEHVLAWHLTGPAGVAILPHLLNLLSAKARSINAAAQTSSTTKPVICTFISSCIRLLRLLSRQMFDSTTYQDLVFHSRGAYGAIYRARMQDAASGSSQHVMIKAIDLPTTGFDRCVLPDVFGEVTILDKYALQPALPALLTSATQLSTPFTGSGFQPGLDLAQCMSQGRTTEQRRQALHSICQLRDYGLTQGAYWLVMHRYRCSLAEWRARQPKAQGPAAIAMYLAVLLQIVDAMTLLASDSVIHFDLKAANVLIQPLDGVKDSQLYGQPPPPPCRPPFTAVLADFGEARAYRNADEAYTARNRGTEVYKSPEMLMMHSFPASLAGAAPDGVEDHSRGRTTRAAGAGLASDIWSFGCLTYELLSGSTLFNESDYASVTHRVVFGSGPHLVLTSQEVGALGSYGASHLQALVEGILVRDHTARPSLAVIQGRLQQLREEMLVLAGGQTPAPA